MRASARDTGSVTVEMVVLTPLLVLLTLFAVFAGRSAEGLTGVQHAADQGARAASKVSLARMQSIGTEAVLTDLASRNTSCVAPRVSVVIGDNRRTVSVRVECSASDSGLGLLGVPTPKVDATSTEVIDFYRGGDE